MQFSKRYRSALSANGRLASGSWEKSTTTRLTWWKRVNYGSMSHGVGRVFERKAERCMGRGYLMEMKSLWCCDVLNAYRCDGFIEQRAQHEQGVLEKRKPFELVYENQNYFKGECFAFHALRWLFRTHSQQQMRSHYQADENSTSRISQLLCLSHGPVKLGTINR